MYQVAAFGNPLLDITVQISTNDLIKKYNLKEDDQIDIPASKMIVLYEDIRMYPAHISPGGCSQNTLRVLQWLLKIPNSTIFFGGIGNDDQGQILNSLMLKTGVKTKYLIHENYVTGTCIALVKDKNRCLIAHLGAAEHYAADELKTNLDILKTVKICYMEGFFLIKRLETAHEIDKFCLSNNLLFVFNLNGPYLCKMYPTEVVKFAENCDILFGNLKEYVTLGEILSIKNPKQLAITLSKTYKNKTQTELTRFGKVVIMTNGAKNVFCAYNNGDSFEFEVMEIPVDNFKDTTGAGDSFVAGFLAGLLMKRDIKECIKCGCWTAGQIIQQIGCTIPNFVPDI